MKKQMYTYAGLALEDAIQHLDDPIDPAAYKAIPGAQAMTDIKPEYLYEVLRDLFGPIGLGWNYSYDPSLIRYTQTDNIVDCQINSMIVTVYLYNESGEGAGSVQIQTNGGSDNRNGNVEWATRGAITNAIGAAWAKLGWQSSVYKGKRSHTNVAAEYKAFMSKKALASSPTVASELPLGEWIKEYNLPERYVGKKLSDLSMADSIDAAVVKWLAGTTKNSKNVGFNPTTEEQVAAHELAKLILSQ
jgi:hypothetical protein